MNKVKRTLVIGLLVVVLILGGCASSNPVTPSPEPSTPDIVAEPEPASTAPEPEAVEVAEPEPATGEEDIVVSPGENVMVDLGRGRVVGIPDGDLLSVNVDGMTDVGDGFALSNPTVILEGVYPGWSGSAPLTIINGSDYARIFHLKIQQPGSSLTEGYQRFPEEYFDWISIEDMTPRVAIGGTKKIAVTLAVPYKMPPELRGNKYDVRILVEDWSQTGFIQIAAQGQWLIGFWDGIEVE